MTNLNIHIDKLIKLTFEAGDIIMGYYQDSEISINWKEDDSPVTIADIAASDFIVSYLRKMTPNIPIISEEDMEYRDPSLMNSKYFWLIDPVDGTKSFIQGEGLFTVNIALIDKDRPILGIIGVPQRQQLYYAYEDKAYKMDRYGTSQQIYVRESNSDNLVATLNDYNMDEQTKDYITHLNIKEIMPAASSIKFCIIAEGSADIYPRFNRTMEWDTASGHAILNAAGGSVTDFLGNTLLYGKRNFINSNFIAKGKINIK